MGEAMLKGANRQSDSSITQNEMEFVPSMKAEHVGAAGSVGPGANTGTGAPKRVNIEGDESHYGSICSVECSRAEDGPSAKVPRTDSDRGAGTICVMKVLRAIEPNCKLSK
ncbi:hypothetical protein UY3_04714 [Chelonia mydas]|uniref:Uncharacterized protein n=1 Tax=Chelonia mydas TaxID=8469 RepID=M7BLH7_CHEMY|nr:hypothetical protein UY3_04714 [Chelonia mydas]